MKIKKILIAIFLSSLLALGAAWISRQTPPILTKPLSLAGLGEFSLTEPLWGSHKLVVVFLDTSRYSPTDIGRRLAASGMAAVVADSRQFFRNFTAESKQCLDAGQIDASLDSLLNALPSSSADLELVVAGIADGALIPFVHAQAVSKNPARNVSIGFSVDMADNLLLCPPYLSQARNGKLQLRSAPAPEGQWRSAWTDQPDNDTALFIRELGNIDSRIAAYDTPLDALLVDELKNFSGLAGQPAPPMPIVETPAARPGPTATIFYSGDGGWRDLDRTVAGEMAEQNYAVAGVDVLRYFWERKTAEQAAADLSATLDYYRKTWGSRSFVLAGYSFGADILPSIYNRLPAKDRDSIGLLVLVALAKHADFEIHVAGWLGQSSDEQPLAPELNQIPKNKILCIYGQEEKTETACTSLQNSAATILELPGGHHFDQDYPKLTRQILDVYRQHDIQ